MKKQKNLFIFYALSKKQLSGLAVNVIISLSGLLANVLIHVGLSNIIIAKIKVAFFMF